MNTTAENAFPRSRAVVICLLHLVGVVFSFLGGAEKILGRRRKGGRAQRLVAVP